LETTQSDYFRFIASRDVGVAPTLKPDRAKFLLRTISSSSPGNGWRLAILARMDLNAAYHRVAPEPANTLLWQLPKLFPPLRW